jgi:hypothetical protein
MLIFEKAYEFTSTIGSHTSFEEEECAAYFGILMSLPEKSTIVEVGLEYGRSSSIALQVATERQLGYWGIDPEIKPEFRKMLATVPRLPQMSLSPYRSSETDTDLKIGAILIDGDHSYAGVSIDCHHFLPSVSVDGYAFFHDYRRESLPDVTKAVDDYMKDRPQWQPVGVAGTLGVWRRIA